MRKLNAEVTSLEWDVNRRTSTIEEFQTNIKSLWTLKVGELTMKVKNNATFKSSGKIVLKGNGHQASMNSCLELKCGGAWLHVNKGEIKANKKFKLAGSLVDGKP